MKTGSSITKAVSRQFYILQKGEEEKFWIYLEDISQSESNPIFMMYGLSVLCHNYTVHYALVFCR